MVSRPTVGREIKAMQAKKSWPGSLCHKLKLGLSRTNFFMSQNFRRPQIDPRRCPKTLSNPKFDADSISEVRSVVSLDLGALQHAWLRSMARKHGVQVADFERSIQVKTFKSMLPYAFDEHFQASDCASNGLRPLRRRRKFVRRPPWFVISGASSIADRAKTSTL